MKGLQNPVPGIHTLPMLDRQFTKLFYISCVAAVEAVGPGRM